MLKGITWENYFLIVAAMLAVYYFIIILLYYRDEVRQLLAGKDKATKTDS